MSQVITARTILIRTRVLDDNWERIFEADTRINGERLIQIAKSRESLARRKGMEWTAGAVPFFGTELIRAMKAEELGPAIDDAAIQVAMAAWLLDSIYGGLGADAFMGSTLQFTMLPGGPSNTPGCRQSRTECLLAVTWRSGTLISLFTNSMVFSACDRGATRESHDFRAPNI